MESLKLRVEEEREYYSVVAALPGVRKQGMWVGRGFILTAFVLVMVMRVGQWSS